MWEKWTEVSRWLAGLLGWVPLTFAKKVGGAVTQSQSPTLFAWVEPAGVTWQSI